MLAAWSEFYSNSTVWRTVIQFLHLGGLLVALEAGAEDVQPTGDGGFEVTSAYTDFAVLRDALDAFVGRNTELAQHVLDEDDKLDDLKTQVFRELLTYMLSDPTTIEPALDLILVSRHLERIGDHADNICENAIFMVEGKDVRHVALDLLDQELNLGRRPEE